jgi:L-threonylcarbamoyladenylate synthase
VIDQAVAAVRDGKPVIIPTDTVYGLVATPFSDAPVRRLYALKGRDMLQPAALMAPDVDMLFELVPELRGRSGTICRALLPGPFTLVLPNPARRFRWLAGSNPDAIGVRVPELAGAAARIVAGAGGLVATSANVHGGADPARLSDVPEELRNAVAVTVDGGELNGIPSTVLDLTGAEPRLLREGAVPAAEALERAQAALV